MKKQKKTSKHQYTHIDVFQTSPNTNFPQLSYILITSCIQEFRDYVQSTLLYGLRSSNIQSSHEKWRIFRPRKNNRPLFFFVFRNGRKGTTPRVLPISFRACCFFFFRNRDRWRAARNALASGSAVLSARPLRLAAARNPLHRPAPPK